MSPVTVGEAEKVIQVASLERASDLGAKVCSSVQFAQGKH